MKDHNEKCPVCGKEQEKGFTYCQDRACSSPMDPEYYRLKAENRKKLVNQSKIVAGICGLILPLYSLVYAVCFVMGEWEFIDDMEKPVVSYFSISEIILPISLFSIIYGSILLIKKGNKLAYLSLLAPILLLASFALLFFQSNSVFVGVEIGLMLVIFVFSIINAVQLIKWHKEG
ncbi:MAG: hypothetical protein RBS56_04790 [Candidatus Gracilibacteria bacterium]|jgi:hypothetical protein|nr:hypothetical protein [Candidatus Gracilibacteria bacterium]